MTYIVKAHPKNNPVERVEKLKSESLAKRWVALLERNGWIVTKIDEVAS